MVHKLTTLLMANEIKTKKQVNHQRNKSKSSKQKEVKKLSFEEFCEDERSAH